MDTTNEGRTYIQRYQVADFPHVAIIDPRTGRLLWRKEGWTQQNPLTADVFAEMAMDFCSRNSFDRPPQAPKPRGKRPVHELSEDEQMQAAMRASMQEVTELDGSSDDDAMDDDEVEEVKPPAAEEPKVPSMVDELLAMTVEAEPAGGARMQLKMPDGKRIVRKFNPTDAVKTIYAFVAVRSCRQREVFDHVSPLLQQNSEEAKGGREFILMAGFPPSDLVDKMDATVDDCKLAGQAVSVRWKD